MNSPCWSGMGKLLQSNIILWIYSYMVSVQKKIWHSTPVCWCLGRPASKVGIWELGRGMGSHPHDWSDKSGSLCLDCLFKQCGLSWAPAFLLGIWILVYSRQRLPTWPAPSENLEYWVSKKLSWLAAFHPCSWSNYVNLCDYQERILEACSWFPWTFLPMLLFLCWYCLVYFCHNKS